MLIEFEDRHNPTTGESHNTCCDAVGNRDMNVSLRISNVTLSGAECNKLPMLPVREEMVSKMPKFLLSSTHIDITREDETPQLLWHNSILCDATWKTSVRFEGKKKPKCSEGNSNVSVCGAGALLGMVEKKSEYARSLFPWLILSVDKLHSASRPLVLMVWLMNKSFTSPEILMVPKIW